MTRQNPPASRWSFWSLISQPATGKVKTPHASHLVVPPIPKSSLPPLLSALLPDRDHNEELLRTLKRLPPPDAAAQPVLSVFAADPFIQGKCLAQRLLEKGFSRIVNWPTTAQYGADFCVQLDSVNLGPRQEYVGLLRLAEQGLAISLAVCTAEAAADIARLRPQMVFLAPTFDIWTNGRMRADNLLRRCAALADAVPREIPIVLMAARASVSLTKARKAGAVALLSA